MLWMDIHGILLVHSLINKLLFPMSGFASRRAWYWSKDSLTLSGPRQTSSPWPSPSVPHQTLSSREAAKRWVSWEACSPKTLWCETWRWLAWLWLPLGTASMNNIRQIYGCCVRAWLRFVEVSAIWWLVRQSAMETLHIRSSATLRAFR